MRRSSPYHQHYSIDLILRRMCQKESRTEQSEREGEVEESSSSKRFRSSDSVTQMYSDDMNDCLRTFCCLCDRVVNLSTLGKHTRIKHNVLLRDYTVRWGDPKQQLLQLVLHRCRLCGRDVELDHDELLIHLKETLYQKIIFWYVIH